MNLFDYAETYPYGPGYKGRDTAVAAADAMAPRVARLRRLCLEALSNGPLTADECAARLGIDKLSIRPRFSELSSLGKIIDTGERRHNSSGKRAIVWRIAH